MYISANIDNCALIIKDFLPEDFFKEISEYKYKPNLTSYDKWESNLYKDKHNNVTMKKVNTLLNFAVIEQDKIESKSNLFKKFFKILIDCPFIPYQVNSKIALSYYEYNKFSGINWHNDHGYTLNYSFYIHQQWDKDWGGETIIDTKRGLPLSCTPMPNSLLIIKNNISHKVNPVIGPNKRKVLQIRGVFYE
jgi:Rps23 Pro-64 3,4-dihydroxylase Tpa1-like proline 4-hydroxylase